MGKWGLDGFSGSLDNTNETEEERLERERQEELDRLYEARRMAERSSHSSIDGDWLREHEVDELPLYDYSDYSSDDDKIDSLSAYTPDLGDPSKETIAIDEDYLFEPLDGYSTIPPEKISDDRLKNGISDLLKTIELGLIWENDDSPYRELFDLLKKRFDSLNKQAPNIDSYRELYKNVYDLERKINGKDDKKTHIF